LAGVSSQIDIIDLGDKTYQININAEDETGLLIGFRGENISSLQTILGMMVKSNLGEWKRILVNIGDYREKQENKLKELGDSAADRAIETGQSQPIYNLNALQRRVVHMHLSNNTTEIKNVDKKILGQLNQEDPNKILKELVASITMAWKPYWMGDFNIMVRAYNYQFETNTTNSTNKYQVPTNPRSFAIQLKDLGIITDVIANKSTGQLSPATQAEVDLILGYFKMFNFNPLDVNIQQYVSMNITDLKNYLKSEMKPKPQSQVPAGSNVPPKNVYEMINTYLATKLQFEVNPAYRKLASIDKKINKG
jgi:predicted RNA-binding protein YlqC (UPF0109 family)